MTINLYSPKPPLVKPVPGTKPLAQRNAPALYTVCIVHAPDSGHETSPLPRDAALRLLDHAADLYGDVMHNILYFDTDANGLPTGFSARQHGDAALVATVRLIVCEGSE